MTKWVRRVGWLLPTASALVAATAAIYGWRALPQTRGELRLAGLQGEVIIERDEHGIPTIKAPRSTLRLVPRG